MNKFQVRYITFLPLKPINIMNRNDLHITKAITHCMKAELGDWCSIIMINSCRDSYRLGIKPYTEQLLCEWGDVPAWGGLHKVFTSGTYLITNNRV